MAACDKGLVSATEIDGRTYALGSSCSGQAKWQEGKGRGQVQLEEGGKQELIALTAVAITPDGRYTVAGSEWGQLLLLGMQRSAPECYNVQLPDCSTILAASISPDGHNVTGISSSDGVRTWEWKLQTLHKEPVTLPASTLRKDLHLSSDGKRATGEYKYWLATCRIGRPFKEVTNLSISLISSCSATPDGRFAATGHDDKTARIWDLEQATWFTGLALSAPVLELPNSLPEGPHRHSQHRRHLAPCQARGFRQSPPGGPTCVAAIDLRLDALSSHGIRGVDTQPPSTRGKCEMGVTSQTLATESHCLYVNQAVDRLKAQRAPFATRQSAVLDTMDSFA